MRPIPKKIREQITNDAFMTQCCFTGSSQIVWEHAFKYAGKQINEVWAIIPVIPEYNNDNQGMQKDKNKAIAYLRLLFSDPLYYEEQKSKYNINDFEIVSYLWKVDLRDVEMKQAIDRCLRYRIEL